MVRARSRACERSSSPAGLRRPGTPEAGWLTSDPRDVFAGAGVDLDPFTRVDEERYLDDLAGLERGRLARTGDTVPLQPRLRLGDRQVDRSGDLHLHDLTLEHRQDGDRVLDDVVSRFAQCGRRHLQLVVALRVHEDVLTAVAVEELHVALVQDGLLDADTCVERAVDDLTSAHVLEAAAHEGPTLA